MPGQISLGHAAFFGLGAYSSGVLTTKYSIHPAGAFLSGILLSALVAFLVGKPTLRLKGHYMAVATLGFGEILFIIFNELSPLTGGPSGLSGIPPLTLGGIPLEGAAYLYLVWGLVILLLIFSLNVINSRVGRALRAVHGSELAASAMGVDASRYKVRSLCAERRICLHSGQPLRPFHYFYQSQLLQPDVFHLIVDDGGRGGSRDDLGSAPGGYRSYAFTRVSSWPGGFRSSGLRRHSHDCSPLHAQRDFGRGSQAFRERKKAQ